MVKKSSAFRPPSTNRAHMALACSEEISRRRARDEGGKGGGDGPLVRVGSRAILNDPPGRG